MFRRVVGLGRRPGIGMLPLMRATIRVLLLLKVWWAWIVLMMVLGFMVPSWLLLVGERHMLLVYLHSIFITPKRR
jgi:hypothetical protein